MPRNRVRIVVIGGGRRGRRSPTSSSAPRPPRSRAVHPPMPPSTPGSTPSVATPGSPERPSSSSATASSTPPGSARPIRRGRPVDGQHAVPARIGVQGHDRPRRRPARRAGRSSTSTRLSSATCPTFAARGPGVRDDHHRPPAARPDERNPDVGWDRATLRSPRRRSRRASGARECRAGVRAGRRVPLLQRQLRRARTPRRGRVGRVVRGVPATARVRAARHGPRDGRSGDVAARTASATRTDCGSVSRTPTSRSIERTSRRPASSAPARTTSAATWPPSSIPTDREEAASQARRRSPRCSRVRRSTGVGDERYGLGWAETTYRGERMVAHAGSTTDMASFVALAPGSRTWQSRSCSTPRARCTSCSTSPTRSVSGCWRWRWAQAP